MADFNIDINFDPTDLKRAFEKLSRSVSEIPIARPSSVDQNLWVINADDPYVLPVSDGKSKKKEPGGHFVLDGIEKIPLDELGTKIVRRKTLEGLLNYIFSLEERVNKTIQKRKNVELFKITVNEGELAWKGQLGVIDFWPKLEKASMFGLSTNTITSDAIKGLARYVFPWYNDNFWYKQFYSITAPTPFFSFYHLAYILKIIEKDCSLEKRD